MKEADDIDMRPAFSPASLQAATQRFAALLAEAIEAGTERPIAAAAAVEPATERPIMLPPREIADAPPPRPQALRGVADRARDRRRAFADAFAARLSQERSGRPRPPVGRFTILDLSDCVCRFPLTDNAPFLFCGSPTEGARSYCREHHAICFQSAENKS